MKSVPRGGSVLPQIPPHAEACAYTNSGRMRCRCFGVEPVVLGLSRCPVLQENVRVAHQLANLRRPAGVRMSTSTTCLPWFNATNLAEQSPAIGGIPRSGSPPGGSMRTTSAPSKTSSRPASGPCTRRHDSTTRRPASGRSPGGPGLVETRRRRRGGWSVATAWADRPRPGQSGSERRCATLRTGHRLIPVSAATRTSSAKVHPASAWCSCGYSPQVALG